MEITASIRSLIELALKEDIGAGDLTTDAIIPSAAQGAARIIAREPLVVCGQDVAREVFVRVHPELSYSQAVADGTQLPVDGLLGTVQGPLGSILTAERTVLNFLQHLSGIATTTANVVSLVAGKIKVLDTRKTTPGFRELEKYAVRVGGGTNHRQGLFDAVLIKNNHIDAAKGEVSTAITAARKHSPQGTVIQVEVRNEQELVAAIAAGPDAILFDNYNPQTLATAVALVRARSPKKIFCEASGGITRATICAYAETGVDAVSMGSLTHSAPSADISLRYLA